MLETTHFLRPLASEWRTTELLIISVCLWSYYLHKFFVEKTQQCLQLCKDIWLHTAGEIFSLTPLILHGSPNDVLRIIIILHTHHIQQYHEEQSH